MIWFLFVHPRSTSGGKLSIIRESSLIFRDYAEMQKPDYYPPPRQNPKV